MIVCSCNKICVKMIEPFGYADISTILNKKTIDLNSEQFDDVLSNLVFDDKINMEEDTDEIDHYSHID